MSKRLIYAEDAITVLQRCYCGIEVKRKRPVTENERFFYFDVLQGLEDLPSAQPQRIKGRWKRTKANSGYNAEWVCSICGYTVYAEFCNYNYCSSCGSDMRGD